MLKPKLTDLQIIHDFLRIPTPTAWLQVAITQLPTLLLDHAHCERKAAATALNFISKYPEKAELVKVMSPLAREELLHFEKVLTLMQIRNIPFAPLQPSAYAQQLHQFVCRQNTLERLTELLLIGAIIEARSCERFHALTTIIKDEELVKFYRALFKAESRHFQDYLQLAKCYCPDIIDMKLQHLLDLENALITSTDTVFRFHSGVPN